MDKEMFGQFSSSEANIASGSQDDRRDENEGNDLHFNSLHESTDNSQLPHQFQAVALEPNPVNATDSIFPNVQQIDSVLAYIPDDAENINRGISTEAYDTGPYDSYDDDLEHFHNFVYYPVSPVHQENDGYLNENDPENLNFCDFDNFIGNYADNFIENYRYNIVENYADNLIENFNDFVVNSDDSDRFSDYSDDSREEMIKDSLEVLNHALNGIQSDIQLTREQTEMVKDLVLHGDIMYNNEIEYVRKCLVLLNKRRLVGSNELFQVSVWTNFITNISSLLVQP